MANAVGKASLIVLLLFGPAAPAEASLARWAKRICTATWGWFGPTSEEEPRRAIPEFLAEEFLERLHEQGARGIGIRGGMPVVLRSEGPIPLPIYTTETPDVAFGLGILPNSPTEGSGMDLHRFAYQRGALMYRNWSVVRIPEAFKKSFEYPETGVSDAWDLSRHMDYAIAKGRTVHFNLEGLTLDPAVAKYREAIATGRSTATSTNWELGRVVHGLLTGKYPRDQVRFWNGWRELTPAEVDALLARFR